MQGAPRRRRTALQGLPRPAGRPYQALLPPRRLRQRTAGGGHRIGALPRAQAESRSRGQPAGAGDGFRRPGDPARRQRAHRAVHRAGAVACHLSPSAGRDPARGAAYAGRRRRGAGRRLRDDGQCREKLLFDPHQCRHPLAQGQAVDRRRGDDRPFRLYQIPRGTAARGPEAGDGCVLRHVQDLRAHDRHRPVFAAQAERGLRQGAQVSRFGHALARRRPDPGGGDGHADRPDRCQPADALPLFPAARADAWGFPAALLRHLSAAGAR